MSFSINRWNIDTTELFATASMKKMNKRLIFWAGVLMAMAFNASAAGPILLENAIVHTVSGETLSGQTLVVMQNGKIKSISTNDAPRRLGVEKTYDLKGQHLYPGLIMLDSALGLSEIDAVRATQDTTEVGEYTPDVQSWIAVNPASELLPVARANGLAYFEASPQGGPVAGLSGLLKLDGWTTEEMAVKLPAALHVYWPSMELNTTPKEKFSDKAKFKSLEDQAAERSRKLKALGDFFEEARAYARARAAITNHSVRDPGINPPWEAMLPVVEGKIPIMVHAIEVRAIKSAIEWAHSNHWEIVIVGARDAWQVADKLAAAKIPVIFEYTFFQPTREFDPYDANFKTPAILQKAGVRVAFSDGPDSFGAAMARNLPYLASQSVAFGLSHDEALKGITLYPAQFLRVDDRLGSIEIGKDATLFTSDGDILDLRSHVTHLWIAGKEVSLESRHTRLYETYKNRTKVK